MSSSEPSDQIDGDAEKDEGTRSAAWHNLPVDRVFEQVDTDEEGLTAEEVQTRLDEYGPNEIREEEDISPLKLFLAQFRDFLIYILVFAALLSLGVGLLPGYDPHHAALISLILLANGIFGFVRDYQAEKSIEALREMSAPEATVLRDGEKVTVESIEIVPGNRVSRTGGRGSCGRQAHRGQQSRDERICAHR